MNKARRKELERALELLEEAKAIIEQCHEEEQEGFDNLSEGLQQSENGQKIEAAADNLLCALDEFDTITEYINEATQ